MLKFLVNKVHHCWETRWQWRGLTTLLPSCPEAMKFTRFIDTPMVVSMGFLREINLLLFLLTNNKVIIRISGYSDLTNRNQADCTV